MNPFRENDVPSVPYNKTEVQIARIREAEETKRRKTEAREKTRQVARKTDGYWVVRIVGVIATVIISIIGALAYNAHLRAVYPDTKCIGIMESTYKIGETLVQCKCDQWPPKPTETKP